jgi:hypothetical protein
MPLYTTRPATDENDRFLIHTAELDAEVLKAIASGLTLPPGTTGHSLNHAERRSHHAIITYEKNWLH